MVADDQVMANRGLIWWTLKRIKIKPSSKICLWDDLVQAGFEGLCEAVRDYDPRRGVKFSQMAKSVIRHAVLREIRRSKTIIQPYWHYRREPASESARALRAHGDRIADARSLDPDDILAGPTMAPASDSDDEIDLREQIERLPTPMRETMRLHLAGYTRAEIGRQLGIAIRTVDERSHHAIARLRERMA